MSTSIEWTDETWNPVTGCTKVSQGCKNCYAERVAQRFWRGRAFTDVQEHFERLGQPLRWREPRRVFVNSMSDLFHESVSDWFIAEVFSYMAVARQHTFQLLTKRPERMRALLCDANFQEDCAGSGCAQEEIEQILAWRGEFDCNDRRRDDIRAYDPGWPFPNVWLGVSVEDQATANERIPMLIDAPAALRFVSYEPALGPVDFARVDMGSDICSVLGAPGNVDWIIAGGESGPGARPAHPDWFRDARDQCDRQGVPFFFKQWGEWTPGENTSRMRGRVPSATWFNEAWSFDEANMAATDGHRDDEPDVYRVGKKEAGRHLDGRTWDQFPEVR